MDYDFEFLGTLNEYYPFERYILRNPQPINYLFDDIVLTEIFVPSTEMDDSYDGTGKCYLNENDIYVKVKTKGGEEVRLAYFDFSEGVREQIRDVVKEDFDKWAWECLYTEVAEEDENELKETLWEQEKLIKSKYGECKAKDNFKITSTLDMINWWR